MTLLVTGAAGFIGFHLSRRLLDDGFVVVGLDNLNNYYEVGLQQSRLALLQEYKGFTFVHASLEDREAMGRLFGEHVFERVIHLAAQAGVRYSIENPHAYVDSNLVGFMNVLEACRHHKVGHLIYASSSSVYGPWGRPDIAMFIFTRAILEGKPIQVFNYGKMKRDFTYVDDIVEGMVRLIDRVPEGDPGWDGESPDPGRSYAPYRIYNIGNNKPVELLYFIEVLEKALGKEKRRNSCLCSPGMCRRLTLILMTWRGMWVSDRRRALKRGLASLWSGFVVTTGGSNDSWKVDSWNVGRVKLNNAGKEVIGGR